MKITPEWRVYILGSVLLIALTVCSLNFRDRGGPHFMASLTVAGIAYLLAVRELFAASRETPVKFQSPRSVILSGAKDPIQACGTGGLSRSSYQLPRRVVVIGLVLAAMWHVEFLRLPPGADDDIHRYVWDGRLQRLGYNPYVVVPSNSVFAGLHTPETRTLNNPNLPSPYPPGAQLFFRAVTAVHESTFALKVAFVICDFATALVLLDLLRASGRGAHLVLAYAWNPLLAIEVAGSGHIDIVGALLLVISVAALARQWRAIAALTFGLAVAVKFLPIVLLPLYWKRVRTRDAAWAAVVVALLYLPFLNHGRIPVGSLGTYVTDFRFNGPVFALLHRVAPPQLLAGLAVLVGFATAAWLRQRTSTALRIRSGQAPDTKLHGESATVSSLSKPVSLVAPAFAFAWPMAASLLCAPVVFPWYLLWLLPFLTSASTLVISIWSVSIIPTYVMWHLSAIKGSWGSLPGWVMLLEYGCLVTAAAVILLRRRKFPTQEKSS